MRRRAFLRDTAALAGAVAIGAHAQGGLAPSQDITPLITKITGGRKVEPGGIDIDIPQVAENGNSVPAHIKVESPMTPDDYVGAIHVFAPRNPSFRRLSLRNEMGRQGLVSNIAIDNCVPPEDALVDIGQPEKVGAGSTMAAVFVAMALVAETGSRLKAAGFKPHTFVSPNVPGVAKDHNLRVFDDYTEKLFERSPVDYATA